MELSLAELRLLGAPMPKGVPGSCVDPERESWLRSRFVQRVRSYTGTPYAQRHHPPGSPEFESPLFLDCCGLVRRALMDLRAELGFSVGPWNQAYLYDTLPLDVSGAADMQPGDLVFTTATYFNPKAKRHPHGVVHVEVWAGDGERTVAARWRRGRVQEFPSYRFDSAAYGDARYHFRSISTWLQGVCVSHCSEHAWGRCRRDFPGPKSIFCPDEGAEREDAGHVAQTGPQQKQHEQQQQHRGVENSPPPPPPSHDQWLVTTKPADSPPHGNNNNDDNDEEEESSGFQHSSSALLPLQEVSAEKQQTLGGEGGRPGRLGETRSSGPFFYIGGNNGAALVSEYCLRRGWERTSDRTREDYRLKWCELKSRSAYTAFREGQQLLYQIQNNKVLTSKIGLLCSLRDYERIISKLRVTSQPRMLKMEDFFPHTLRLDVRGERDEFFDSYQEGEKWICKPTGLNQGRGIFLLRSAGDVAALRERLLLDADVGPRTPRAHVPQARIVQRYVTNPLLLDGRKFDVRSYMLIASAAPPIVLFRHGYARLSCQSYSPESNDLTAHLTNQYMQKKSPVYQEVKEETVWTMSRFNDHVNEHCAPHKGLPKDWVLTTFTKRMQQVMTHCFLATKSKLEGKLGLFDLIGCDFLIDEDFKVWLLEMNCNPALQTNCMVLKEVIPQVVNETLDLALETFEKVRRGQRVMPLQTRRDFTLLYNGDPSDPHSRPSWPSSRPYLNLGLLVPRQKQQHQQNHHQQQHQQQQQQRRATKSAARNFALPEPRTPKPRIRYNISIAKVAAPPLQKLSLRPQGVEDDDDEDREEDEEDEAEERGGATLGAITRRVGCSKSARRPLKSAAAPRPTPPDPRHHRWALTLRSRAPAASLSSLSARGGVRSVAALAATISVLTTSFPHEASATWKTALSLPVQKAEEEAEEEEEEQEEEVDSQKLPPLPSPDDASPATTAQKQLSERGA
ncbi:unnamed protein product [Lampetra planeri]